MRNYGFFIILFFITSNCLFSQSEKSKQIVDSVRKYLFLSKEKSFSQIQKENFAKQAINLAREIDNDSLELIALKNISTFYSIDSDDNKKLLYKIILLSKKVQDSSTLANSYYELGKYFRRALVTDSCFYYYHNAEKLYQQLGDDWNMGQVLLSIGNLQRDEKDYTGSEITLIESLSYFEKLKPTPAVQLKKSFAYNNLGLVLEQLSIFDEAISYYEQALNLKESLKGDNVATIENSKNNLGLAYKNAGDYAKAEKYFKEILDNENLPKERPETYALVLDNYANTKFLSKNHDGLPKMYLKALKVCDSIESDYRKIAINQHLAEYYNFYDNKDSAKYYAYRAKNISEKYHNDDLLKSLLILSEVEDDSLSVKYYKEYIQLNDSIQKNERAIRNKFSRIRYETNKIEKEKERIAREKLLLIIILGAVLFTFVLIYIILSQRAKNKELRFAKQQQESNEEIYNLMLSQQDKVDEAKALEKKRISEELHDGILGRLFGTRLSLDSLNMANSEEAVKTRGNYIEQLKDIEQDIRKVSHDLNTDFISNSGYIDIVKSLLETQSKAYGYAYEFDYDDTINWEDISNKTKIHIYRILQESLQNIYKHAQASKVKISIRLKNNVIWLAIKDDGVGFDVMKAKKGIGIKNINSRASEINAIVTIESEINKGSTILIKIPLE